MSVAVPALPHTLQFQDGASIDSAAADRLLSLADQFLENWGADEDDVADGDKDPELAQRRAEWAAIRPLFAAAPTLLSASVDIGLAGDVRDELRRAQLQEAIAEAGAWALLDPRLHRQLQKASPVLSGLPPAQADAILNSCNLRVALTLEHSATTFELIGAPIRKTSAAMEAVGEPDAERLTIAYVAMGARQAIETQEFGSLPAEVSDHFSGELGFIDAVTSEAWRLDAVANAIVAAGEGLSGVFCYEIAEPFGEQFAKALIAERMDNAPQPDPDVIAQRVFSEFIEGPSHYHALLAQGTKKASPAPGAALGELRGVADGGSGQALAWSSEDSAAATAEGWDVFDSSERGLEIERIDAPEDVAGEPLPPAFASDDHAIGHVYAKAQEGSALHQKALLLTLSQMRGLIWPPAEAALVPPRSAEIGSSRSGLESDGAVYSPGGMAP